MEAMLRKLAGRRVARGQQNKVRGPNPWRAPFGRFSATLGIDVEAIYLLVIAKCVHTTIGRRIQTIPSALVYLSCEPAD